MFPDVRQRTIGSVSDLATPFGCCNFFDQCNDEIMTLHYGGRLPLLDWMGFNVSDECYRSVEFIDYVRPEQSGGLDTAGYIGDACADPNSIEYGASKITVEDFGRYGRSGPTREIMRPKYYCKTSPRVRLDGTQVTDEDEWDMLFASDQVIADVSKHLITGNAATPGQFDGLEQWVATTYASGMLDSVIINWAGNPMSGGAGITWNGAAVAATYNLVDVMLAVYRRIKQRISWARALRNQPISVGDMILVMPTFLVDCFLDHYTCWSVCDGSQYNEVALQSYEARAFRNGLLGGMFGFGQVTFDGQLIPILAYDWELIKGPKTGDIYFLTGGIGGQRIWEGEHLSAAEAAGKYGGQGYFQSDGSRILGKIDLENECEKLKLWMHPRLFCFAPWAQARFMSVQCENPGGPLSPDPAESSFHPLGSSFSAAECP